MSFGLTTQGFRRKRYADVLASMESRARDLFGEGINLTSASPLGVILRIAAWSVALVWQVAEAVYNAAFVGTATGDSLDLVGQYIGVTRRQATYAAGEVSMAGDEHTVIPAGFRVATSGGIAFATDEEAVIPGGGSIDAAVTAVEAGTGGNVPASTITVIVSPLAGLDSVINGDATSGGLQQETDAEFRARYYLSTATGGASTTASIRAALLALAGVRAAHVDDNKSMVEVDGVPPKAIHAIVLGGIDEDVALVILRGKAGGIQAYGSTVVTVEDDAGVEHDIGFSRPTEVSVEVDVTLTTDATFPADGEDLVRSEIIRYIGGEDEDGQMYTGLGLGATVVASRLIQAIYAAGVPGIVDAELTLNRVGEAPGTSNLPMDPDEIAETDYTLVIVGTA